MRIVVLDDIPAAIEYAKRSVADLARDLAMPLEVDPVLSAKIDVYNFNERLAALGSMQGEALFIVDLGYDVVRADDRREAELRRKYEIPHEVVADKTEGFASAVAIIRNTKLTKCVIVINTNRGLQGAIYELLKGIVRRYNREQEVLIKVSPYALTNSEEQAHEIVNDAVRSFIDFTRDNKPSPFELYMSKARGTDHDDAHDPKKAVHLMALLLNMSEAEVETEICEKVGRAQVYDALKTMGTNVTSRPLAASGAWLLALSAYRHIDNGRSWKEIFKIEGPWETDLRTCFLLPKQQLSTLRVSIRLFYEMCLKLFKPPDDKHKDEKAGPLRSVTLSKSKGLRFELGFPSNQAVRGSSLFENVAECRELLLTDQPLHHHDTSRAIWRYWISGAIADGGDLEGLFGEGVWRMNIKSTEIALVGNGTLITFFK